MNTYTYVNIFETIGIEHLCVITFLIVFLWLCRTLFTETDKSSKQKDAVKLTVKSKNEFLED